MRAPRTCKISAIGFLVLSFLSADKGLAAGPLPSVPAQAESESARESYGRALQWLEQGHAAKALEEINTAIALNPSDAHLYNLRGLAHSSLGERAKAADDFRKVIQLSPQSTVGYNNLAALLWQQGETERALPLFATALKISPEDFTALVGLGAILLNQGKVEKAQSLLQQAWKKRPGDFQTGYELALALRQMKKPEDAWGIIGHVSIPNEPAQAAKYYSLRGAIATDLGDPEEALKQYKEAYQLSPQAFDIYLALAQACLKVANCDPNQAIAGPPVSLSAQQHFVAGLLFASHGFYALAIPHFGETVKQAPGSYSAAYDLSVAEEESGNTEAAMETLRALIRHRPQAELYNLLASVEEKKGLYVKAAGDYERAVEMDPSQEKYFFDLGTEYLAHFTFGAALQAFKAATQKFPSASREFTGLGFALYAQQSYPGSAKAFLKALEIDPQSRTALKAYSSLIGLVVPAGWEAISPLLKRLVDAHPKSPSALYCYGASLFQHALSSGDQVNFREAQTLLEQAIRLQTKFPEAHLELGKLFATEKDYQSALREFQESLLQDPQSATGHYQLAQIYRDLNQIGLAERELRIYTQLTKAKEQRMAQTRAAIKQFILAERLPPPTLRKDHSPSGAKP
ncbi:MAG: tetratricopeptide repeat protein [Terriglobia bacterium]